MIPRLRWISLSILPLLALAACGPSTDNPIDKRGNPAHTAPASSKPSSTPSLTLSPSPSASASPLTFPYKTSVTFTTTNGFKGSLTLERGQLMPGKPGLVNGQDVLGKGCTDVTEIDAVIPFRLTASNDGQTTFNSFADFGSLTQAGSSSFGIDIEVPGGGELTDCLHQTNNDGTLEVTAQPLQPSSSLVVPGFIVVKNYYDPAHANDNVALLRNMVLVMAAPGKIATAVGAGPSMDIIGLMGVRETGVAMEFNGGDVPGCVYAKTCTATTPQPSPAAS